MRGRIDVHRLPGATPKPIPVQLPGWGEMKRIQWARVRNHGKKTAAAYWPPPRGRLRITTSPKRRPETMRTPRVIPGAPGTIHADDQPVDPQAARAAAFQAEAPGHAGVPAEARRVPAGQDDDPEKAELGPAKDRPGPAVERDGSDRVHPGRGAQPAGALDRPGPRRRRPRPAGRSQPHHPRRPRRPGSAGPQAGPVEVWGEEGREISSQLSAVSIQPDPPLRAHAGLADR